MDAVIVDMLCQRDPSGPVGLFVAYIASEEVFDELILSLGLSIGLWMGSRMSETAKVLIGIDRAG